MAKKGGLGKGMEALIGSRPKEDTKKVVDEAASNTDDKATEQKKTAAKKEPSKKTQASPKKKKNTSTKKSAPEREAEQPQEADQTLPIHKIEPNRDQPRKVFDEEALQELAESVKTFGILQPLIVQKQDDYYRIIAGERRWRAAKMAGLKKVPVIIKDLSEKELLEISLIENLQREDLNPIEEAEGYQKLLDDFHMTQEELAKRVSKSRSAITNTVRLLKLEDSVRHLVSNGALTSGHARTLLSLEDKNLQKEAAERIIRDGLSVRDTERLVKSLAAPKRVRALPDTPADDFIYRDIEEKMRQILGTKVQIKNRKKSGRIEIEYFSPEELNRILEMLQTIQ